MLSCRVIHPIEWGRSFREGSTPEDLDRPTERCLQLAVHWVAVSGHQLRADEDSDQQGRTTADMSCNYGQRAGRIVSATCPELDKDSNDY